MANKITGAKAGGQRELPMGTGRAARVALFRLGYCGTSLSGAVREELETLTNTETRYG